MTIWLTVEEASKLVNRSPLTLRDWRTRGQVVARQRKNTWEFDRDSLLRAKELMEWRYEHRRIVPGTGRGRRLAREDMIPLWEDSAE